MNEIGMTRRQVETQIKKEMRYLNHCNEVLLNVKSNIRCTKRAIKMWQSYLKKIVKGEVNKSVK